MEAIRQFLKVENQKVSITLPDDFIADEVEVIILAKNEINYQLSEEQIQLLDDRLNEPESEYITSSESLNRLKEKYGF
jgi:(p)ppGpp synthase/HD superfamily hydrolase